MMRMLLLCMLLLAFNIPNIAVISQEQWVPCVPNPNQVELNYRKENYTSYVDVSIEFASSGFNVSDWGTPITDRNNISVDARIWRWTGVDFPVVIIISHTYNLGNLPAGEYLFTFKVWGFSIKNITFTIPIIVPDDYPTIQEAINHANEGDAIYVRAGIYYEHVAVNKTVSLIGENKSTTIIDGMGTGTVLNVTANDVSVTGFTIQKSGSEWVYTMDNGILIQSSNNRVENNVMSYNSAGIFLDSSDNNLLISNNVSNNRYGILLENSRNNTIKSNIILFNKNHGIGFSHSKNNTLASNDMISNYFGIYLWGSENNTLAYNTLSNNEYGIRLSALSSSNALFGNNLYSNGDGILIVESENNVLRDNNLTNNRFEVIGYKSSHYFQDVDTSNLVDGKHIYYLVTRSNLTVNPDTFQNIGYLAFVNCTNIIIERFNAISSNLPNLLLVQTTNSIIKNINITAGIQIIFSSNITLKDIDVYSTSYGLSFKFSDGNKISSSDIYSNNFGIYLDGSYNNILVNNTISNNGVGIRLGGNPSVNNLICHNNFVNNSRQVDYEVLEVPPMYWVNIWDNGYPSGGNYWSDYTRVDLHRGLYQNDTGSDGIGDVPYVIDENNKDLYPLMGPFGPLTTEGENITVFPTDDVNLIFENVTAEGSTTVNKTVIGPEPAFDFKLAEQYYDIKTTANYSGIIRIRIIYDDSNMTQEEENALRLMQWNDTLQEWVDITTYIDIQNNLISGETSHLSIFALFKPSISGSVGRGRIPYLC